MEKIGKLRYIYKKKSWLVSVFKLTELRVHTILVFKVVKNIVDFRFPLRFIITKKYYSQYHKF